MANTDWFEEARYGMFIHWGAYAVAGHGEWIMNREKLTREEYIERCASRWKAENYDPDAWVDLARGAGMKYVVLTTRHHDGFALWDSQVNPFNAARIGPGRDLVKPFAEAVRRGGLRLGFYYSPAAWVHPDYPGPFYRDWPGVNDWKDEASRQRFIDYYHAEIRELLTHYGKVDLFWYDGCIPENIDGATINEEIRRLQPELLITKRNGPPFDIDICEQTIRPGTDKSKSLEACFTLGREANAVWGHAPHLLYRSAQEVISLLLTAAANGANFLLNIGPKPDGTVVEEEARILLEAGAWLERNPGFLSRSDRSPFSWSNQAMSTVKGNRVYLFLSRPVGDGFCWPELRNRVLSARYLASGKLITFRQEGGRLFLEGLPPELPDLPYTTIELEVEGKPEPLMAPTTFWIPN